jgi:Ca2+:H+ antiporter
MTVASMSLMIPTALSFAWDSHDPDESLHSILILSRGTAIILLALYALYLYFQLKTHSKFFEDTPENRHPEHKPDEVEEKKESEKEKETERVLTPKEALFTLFFISITIAICAEYLVGAIDDVVVILHINKAFIGLIIIPIVGNIAEYISAAIAASRNKMDLALGVSLGSSMQIALLVSPALVLLGWATGQPMSLSFEPFGAVVFFLAIIVVTGLVSDGESNYLEGAMLVGT